jgi:uncharacterized phage protein (TIGR01671 family)
MNREIIFRAKNDKNDWVKGDLIHIKRESDTTIRIHNVFNMFDVKFETVGQFTGLTDKNGTKIFEGDILKRIITAGDGEKYISTDIVKFSGACFCTYDISDKNDTGLYLVNWSGHEIEIIGNRHDNPELLIF